jgi:hypothetical protein
MTSKDATVEPIAVNPAKSDCVKSTPKIVVTGSSSLAKTGGMNANVASHSKQNMISLFMIPPLSKG